MNKRDFVAIAIVLLLSTLAFVLVNLGRGEGGTVVITKNGAEYGAYPLGENRIIEIDEDGRNTVVIEDGSVYMKDADCPDKYCEKQGKISTAGDSIICLPHRLSVEIRSDDAAVDAVAR